MKKIILLLLAGALFCSCLKVADDHNCRTAYGAALIYEGTTAALLPNELILIAVEMDIVAEAPLEERDEYADLFFQNFKFRTDGDVYTLSRDGDTYFEAHTGGKSLIEQGAEWKIVKSDPNNKSEREITIARLADSSWMLEIKQMHNGAPLQYNSRLLSLRDTVTTSPRRAKMKISFAHSSVFEPRRALVHTITTDTPLDVVYDWEARTRFQPPTYFYNYEVYSPFSLHDGGSFKDEFIDPASDQADVVDAIFFKNEIYRDVKITYKGFTDAWHWQTIPYYGHKPYC